LSPTGRRFVLTGTGYRPVQRPLTIYRLDSILDQPATRADKIRRKFLRKGLDGNPAGTSRTTEEKPVDH
jgi:hypothetical protein